MKQVKMTVFGVQRRHGISKKGGNPYDMCMVIVGKSVEPRKEELSTVEGFGFLAQEMDADESIIEQVQDYSFPLIANVSIDVTERNDNFYPRIVGVERAATLSSSVPASSSKTAEKA